MSQIDIQYLTCKACAAALCALAKYQEIRPDPIGPKLAKTGDKKVTDEADFMKRLQEMLEKGEPVRRGDHSEEEQAWLKSDALLSSKPVLYAANDAEDMVDKPNTFGDVVR